ncbi:MAG TPA: hypothetical protein DCG72_06305 [Gammaproteobacteria bacterium]|nr:hypothetical protein [Gammaproteobacteria bacterium]
MTFTEYWGQVTTKYPPHLKEGGSKTTIRVQGLKDLMEQSHQHGRDLEKGLSNFKKMNQPESLFENLFKGS